MSGSRESRRWKCCNCLWLSTKFHMQILRPDYRYLIIYLIYATAQTHTEADKSTRRRCPKGQANAIVGLGPGHGTEDRGQKTWDRRTRNANNTAVVACRLWCCPDRGYIINLCPCGTLPGHSVAHGTWHMAHGGTWHLAMLPRG